MRNVPRLPYPLGLLLAARRCNPDCERTEFAQRKSGLGIRTEAKRGQLHIVRLDSKGSALPVTAAQLRRFA
jgi:hypothetical protein